MDKTCLLVKNLPDTITDINEYFRMYYGAINIKKFGRRRAIIKFPDECTAKNALYRLHQSELDNRILSVEYINGQKSSSNNVAVVADCNDDNNISMDTTTLSNIKISNFLKKLYGINSKLNFDQPPPPYLKYNYPKINRNILDSISIALLTIPKFYIQVLHLMNRMNLDPPFIPLKHKLYSGSNCTMSSSSSSESILRSEYLNSNKKLIDTGTQTDNDDDITIIRNYRKRLNLLSSDESELESDNNDNDNLHGSNNNNKLKTSTNRKRKKLNLITSDNNENDLTNEIIKNKFKKLLIQQHQQQQRKDENQIEQHHHQKDKFKFNEIFENNNPNFISNRSQKIEMNVNNLKLPEIHKDHKDNDDNVAVQGNEMTADGSKISNNDEIKINNKNKIITDDDLKYNRINEEQLKELPLFKNYKKGVKTNKLYIKNLNKNVTVDDLKMIYNRYTTSKQNKDKMKLNNDEDEDSKGTKLSKKLDDEEEIDIKLMQYGRMKGQAFITFNKFNDNNDYDIVEKALNETNGYILKNKPMIVCFGKKC